MRCYQQSCAFLLILACYFLRELEIFNEMYFGKIIFFEINSWRYSQHKNTCIYAFQLNLINTISANRQVLLTVNQHEYFMRHEKEFFFSYDCSHHTYFFRSGCFFQYQSNVEAFIWLNSKILSK